mmetsp:Transcript_2248/g.14914  ORF Transcript_2248/g.14914 Transcript_2248/m.14914 type:complete len:88 (+) Transcript_2248:860-1123(+)
MIQKLFGKGLVLSYQGTNAYPVVQASVKKENQVHSTHRSMKMRYTMILSPESPYNYGLWLNSFRACKHLEQGAIVLYGQQSDGTLNR